MAAVRETSLHTALPAEGAAKLGVHLAPAPYGHEVLISLLEETAKAERERTTSAQGPVPGWPNTPHTPSTLSGGPHSAYFDHPGSRRPSTALLRRQASIQISAATRHDGAPPYLLRKVSRIVQEPTEPHHGTPPAPLLRHSSATSPATPPVSPSTTVTLTKDVFKDQEYQAYLDHLTSCSLKTLKSEPAVLVRETARLQQQLADLAYTEYRSFLRANECTRDIKGTFSTMDEQLNALQASLPEVESACSSFATSSTESILKDRKRELLVLNQHSKLVEILEIPQLMDTLIRNGYYDEAMDLQTHVQRLLLRYPQHKILQSVGNELEATTKVMLMQLVNLLKGDVKLPLCIRVMGYLRRIEAVAEPELRLIFLQQRDKFFRKRVDDVCGKEGVGSGTLRDHAEYLRKYIDVCRECFFDIVAQYRAIFSDATATANTNGDTGIDSAAHVNFTSALLYDTASHSTLTHSILSSYVMHRMDHLREVLRLHLLQMTDAAQVASICTQTMYFGMSLGRIGIDFRNVVRHVFEDAIETIVSRTIMDGTTQFLHWLHETTAEAANAITAAASADIAVPAFGSSRQNSSRQSAIVASNPFIKSVYLRHSSTASEKAPSNPSRPSGAAQPLVSAPTSLLAHPPLAYLLNTFFNAFNHLRALPALSLRARIETLIEARLALCAEGLSDVVASVWDSDVSGASSTTADVRQIVMIVADAWCHVLIPAITDGFNRIYPDSSRPATSEKATADVNGVKERQDPWAKLSQPMLKYTTAAQIPQAKVESHDASELRPTELGGTLGDDIFPAQLPDSASAATAITDVPSSGTASKAPDVLQVSANPNSQEAADATLLQPSPSAPLDPTSKITTHPSPEIDPLSANLVDVPEMDGELDIPHANDAGAAEV